MKRLFYGVYTFIVAATLVFTAPVIQKPLFGADETPGKIEKNKASNRTPVKTMTKQGSKANGAAVTGTNTDALKNKAKSGKNKDTRIEDDPIGTRR